MSAAALEELAEKAEALAGRVSSRANKAGDEFANDEEEDDDSEPIGALASIQAAAMKGTRPR